LFRGDTRLPLITILAGIVAAEAFFCKKKTGVFGEFSENTGRRIRE
jgi:hypothetical protein